MLEVQGAQLDAWRLYSSCLFSAAPSSLLSPTVVWTAVGCSGLFWLTAGNLECSCFFTWASCCASRISTILTLFLEIWNSCAFSWLDISHEIRVHRGIHTHVHAHACRGTGQCYVFPMHSVLFLEFITHLVMSGWRKRAHGCTLSVAYGVWISFTL